MKKIFLAAVAVVLLLAACSDDDYHYPSVRLEFLTATTGSDGRLQSVKTDAGQSFAVLEDASDIHATPDTLLRIVANYEQQTAEGVKLYATAGAISPLPRPAESFKEGVKRAPAVVTSIWQGLDYLNIILSIKAQNKQHSLGFVEEADSIDTATGQRVVHLSLYHDDNHDVQAYSRRVYASVPLQKYIKEEGGNTLLLYFSLITYDGTEQCYFLNGGFTTTALSFRPRMSTQISVPTLL
ncbi:MAG: hypothetical protein LBN06_06695 [Prevotellaceae bacterium]|jgi:hypothetical protein|nr:hypothetical protein [Prevotellaceae bacterium]